MSSLNGPRRPHEDVTPLKPSRGKVHDYLAMTLDYTEQGALKLHMKDCVNNVNEEFPCKQEVEATRTVKTPAAEHLFTVNPEAIKLDQERADVYHTTAAKSLFLCKRARPDLQPTVPFLCTRVKEPDEDDWKKLIRMLRYLKDSKELELKLEAEDTGVPTKLTSLWHADAAYCSASGYEESHRWHSFYGQGSPADHFCQTKVEHH